MSLLDSLKRNDIDVHRALCSDGQKFCIRPDWYLDDFIWKNCDYQIWISAICGFVPDGGIVEDMYEQKLAKLYDEIKEFPGVADCSLMGIVTMKESVGITVKRGYELCFGINADVRSAYGALRLVYGLCSLLWLENIHKRVPIAIIYYNNLELHRTYVREDFFREFYELRRDKNKHGMYGAWKVFAWKLMGRPEYLSDKETNRCIDKCSEWYMRTQFKRVVKKSEYSIIIDSGSVSDSKSITSKGDVFERFCGRFLKG